MSVLAPYLTQLKQEFNYLSVKEKRKYLTGRRTGLGMVKSRPSLLKILGVYHNIRLAFGQISCSPFGFVIFH